MWGGIHWARCVEGTNPEMDLDRSSSHMDEGGRRGEEKFFLGAGVLDTSGRLQFIVSPVVSVGRLIVFLMIVNLSFRRRRSSEDQS